MASPVSLYAPAATVVTVGGQPITAAYGPLLGGFIQNPFSNIDQGTIFAEPLFVSIDGPAALSDTGTTTRLEAGGIFQIPPGLTGNVSVNAETSGHKFSGVVFQSSTPFPPTPQPGTFPPSAPTVVTTVIPSYLYQQYQDDDDLQAFVEAYNALAQGYVDWFVNTPLPVYTNALIAGPLLDWVAGGVYGMIRPALSSGRNRDIGPVNTYGPNTLEPNRRKEIGPRNVVATSDDVFKRIMTWNFYKGDGNVFDIRWLKRRIKRFLIGPNGTAPNVDETYEISVTYGNGFIAIRISVGTRTVIGGALPNRFGCNRLTPNALKTLFVPSPTVPFPLAGVLQAALQSGALQLPFQYQTTIAI
jgi:hypothetical protein